MGKLYKVTGYTRNDDLIEKLVRARSKINAKYVAKYYGMTIVKVIKVERED